MNTVLPQGHELFLLIPLLGLLLAIPLAAAVYLLRNVISAHKRKTIIVGAALVALGAAITLAKPTSPQHYITGFMVMWVGYTLLFHTETQAIISRGR